jgi:microcystin-dependent protein
MSFSFFACKTAADHTFRVGEYTALFALLGTTCGGNGINTFALRDLRTAAPNNTQYLIRVSGVFP